MAQKILQDLNQSAAPKRAYTDGDLATVLQAPAYPSMAEPSPPLREMSVTQLAAPRRAQRIMLDLGITTIGQLLDTPVRNLMSQWSFAEQSFARLQQQLVRLMFPQADPGSHEVDYASYAAMVASIIKPAISNRRMAQIVQARLGSEGKPQTLAALGRTYDITRERVRQIEQVGMEQLKAATTRRRMARFWKEVWTILESWKRPYPISRLAKSLATRMAWSEPPPVRSLQRLLELHAELERDSDGNVWTKGSACE
ncbi:MAG: sigma factor-like helix-turn-helix DNA-binding protein [Planctomycetaceae bacterium]|nr:hypothetical protein [Planctomycetaceae bacterium]